MEFINPSNAEAIIIIVISLIAVNACLQPDAYILSFQAMHGLFGLWCT